MKIILTGILLLGVISCTQMPTRHDAAPACPGSTNSIRDARRAWMHVVVIKNRKPSEIAVFLNSMCEFAAKHPESRLIVGAAQAIPDDAGKVLLILTPPENLAVFENMVRALDCPQTDSLSKEPLK